MAPVSKSPTTTVNNNMGTSSGPIVILPAKPITSYNFTPRDSMNETLEDNVNTTPPKKLKEKLRDESPKKDSYAGSPSKEVHNRDSIEFVRPGSSQRNKTKSSVFDFRSPPPKSRPQSGYAHTPRDTIQDSLEDKTDTVAPKKRAEKLKDATPKRAESAGARSSEVNSRASIEFVRPNSSRRNKTRSSVFDFTPPQYKPRRMPNGISNQRYARSPYATHEAPVNGTRHEYRPTTPFAEHNHLTNDQVFSPRKQKNLNLSPIPKTPSPEKAFKRPPPGGYTNNIFG